MVNYHWVKFSRATGSAAIAYTLTQQRVWVLSEVRLHLSAAATQDTLSISIDSNTGAAYDVVLQSQAMNGVADFTWRPNQKVLLDIGDVLSIAFDNNDSRTYGLEVIYE